jgi:hypothetical protein
VTSDEKEAIGTLRMLDCGSDVSPGPGGVYSAYGRIYVVVQDPLRTQEMVRTIVLMDKEQARSYLRGQGFTAEQASLVLEASHCDPPPDYFITSEDMVGKAGVWAHFGLWNFTRAYMVQAAKAGTPKSEVLANWQERFGMSEQQAQQYYYEILGLRSEGEINAWVSPWPGYLTGWRGCGTAENGTVVGCPIGVVVANQAGGIQHAIDAFIYNSTNESQSTFIFGVYQNGQRIQTSLGAPTQLVIAGPEGMRTITFGNPASSSLAVVYDSVQRRAMVVDPLLARSMFTQLFYLEGRYSEHFEKFDDRISLGNQRIITWRVDWNGTKAPANASATRTSVTVG